MSVVLTNATQPLHAVGNSARPAEIPIRSVPSAIHRNGSRVQLTAFDEAYLKRLQSRDAKTERHFEAYFGPLLTIKLRSRLSSRQAVEDVRQETFARVFALVRRVDGVRQADRLGALVNSVCDFVLREHFRASHSYRRTMFPITELSEDTLRSDEPSPTQQCEKDEAQRVVRQILDGLSERDRGVLREVLLAERDKDEVCAEWGVSRNHLRVMIHRAKEAFKAHFRQRVSDSVHGT